MAGIGGRRVAPALLPVTLAVAVAVARGPVAAPPAHRAAAARAPVAAHRAGTRGVSAFASAVARRRGARAPSLPRMLGQMMIAAFDGSEPTPGLLARIRQGEVGGVILFSGNLAGGPLATRALTRELQAAAARGGNPPLLIMTDQEGGEVKRLAGPPIVSPAEMSSPAEAFGQGAATGRLLRQDGVNIDLAPVADVERTPGSFLGSRSFGGDPVSVAVRACAFARGLASQRVAYTLKHFPGLGRAAGNTDDGPVAIAGASNALRADYPAYSRCGRGRLALIMVSSAVYPGLSGGLPAVMSPEIYRRELPAAVGGTPPVTISDDLESGAIAVQHAPARRAVTAGLDLVLYAASEQTSADVYEVLLADARAGVIPRRAIQAADRRIQRLKRGLALRGRP